MFADILQLVEKAFEAFEKLSEMAVFLASFLTRIVKKWRLQIPQMTDNRSTSSPALSTLCESGKLCEKYNCPIRLFLR